MRATSSPSLLLALEVPDGTLPTRLGLHVESTPLGGPVEVALGRSPWHLLAADGVARDGGTMLAPYRTAIGDTVDPVPPWIFSGCIMKANS